VSHEPVKGKQNLKPLQYAGLEKKNRIAGMNTQSTPAAFAKGKKWLKIKHDRMIVKTWKFKKIVGLLP
jgi:hypothetical protein